MLLGFIREPESETRCLNEIVQGHAKSKLKPSGRISDLLTLSILDLRYIQCLIPMYLAALDHF